MSNLSALCLTDAQMQMHGSDFERYLQRYLFPALAVFGIVGNALNLTVLLNRRMRTRANSFLALLAISDICFLTLLLPNVAANYEPFSTSYYFRHAYFHAKVHLLSLANWSSAVAIWCVIAVCADRLIGIRHPLYAHSRGVATWRMCATMVAIVMAPCLLTAYQHVAHVCVVRSYCQGTQLYSKCFPVNQDGWLGNRTNPYSSTFRRFITLSTLLNVSIVIIFPIILLTVLNAMLLCALRRRSSDLLKLCGEDRSTLKPSMDHLRHQRTEQRVTLTVAFIVTMFTLTNGPSAGVQLLQMLYQRRIATAGVATQHAWYNATMACSALVVFGKASNFILFCLCSQHFRRRLFGLLGWSASETAKTSGDRKSTAITNGASIPITAGKNHYDTPKKHSAIVRLASNGRLSISTSAASTPAKASRWRDN